MGCYVYMYYSISVYKYSIVLGEDRPCSILYIACISLTCGMENLFGLKRTL